MELDLYTKHPWMAAKGTNSSSKWGVAMKKGKIVWIAGVIVLVVGVIYCFIQKNRPVTDGGNIQFDSESSLEHFAGCSAKAGYIGQKNENKSTGILQIIDNKEKEYSYKDLGFSENLDVKFVCATEKELYFKLSKNEVWSVELKQQKDKEVPDSYAKKVFESDSEIETFSIYKDVLLYCDRSGMYYEYDMKKEKKNQLQKKYRLVGKNEDASIERWSRIVENGNILLAEETASGHDLWVHCIGSDGIEDVRLESTEQDLDETLVDSESGKFYFTVYRDGNWFVSKCTSSGNDNSYVKNIPVKVWQYPMGLFDVDDDKLYMAEISEEDSKVIIYSFRLKEKDARKVESSLSDFVNDIDLNVYDIYKGKCYAKLIENKSQKIICFDIESGERKTILPIN